MACGYPHEMYSAGMGARAERGRNRRNGHPHLPRLTWAVEQLRLQTPGIMHELKSELPGHHHKTHQPEPIDPLVGERDTIATGQEDSGHEMTLRYWFLGIGAWLTWFGIGIYTWWFTEVSIADYVIASVVWILLFGFTLVGIPIVSRVARNRNSP